MLTMKAKYALMALGYLAAAERNEPVLISEIAEREGIPRKFLELILRELKTHGILDSRKGRGGGYLLRLDPESVTLAQVIRIVDGPIAPVPCLSQTAYRRCKECKDETTCSVRLVLRDLHLASLRVLENTTLASLAAQVRGSRIGEQLDVMRFSI